MVTEPILLIDACVRKNSRTRRLAEALLSSFGKPYRVHDLSKLGLKPLDEKAIEHRDACIRHANYQDYPLAKEFAEAGTIVIAAPHYDFSFPSALKVYLENIYVMGLVTRYDDSGRPVGLCKAKKLYYVSTSGGPMETRFGYEYVRVLATEVFGIKETELIYVDMLDIVGVDGEKKVDEYIASHF